MATIPGGDDEQDDVIPESILSVSKDARYIQQCQELLRHSVAVLFQRKESFDASAPQDRERIRKQMLWMISCILYTIASAKSGRTLGMETLGLRFATDGSLSTEREGPKTTSAQLRRSFYVCTSLLLAATGGLVSEYLSTRADKDSKNDGDSGHQLENRERSRGRERRLIHERLRRQMLERAANSNAVSSTPGFNISNPLAQQQRALASDNTTTSSRNAVRPIRLEHISTIFRQLSKFIYGISSISDGPHDIIQPMTNESEDSGGNSRSTSHSVARWIVRLHLAHFLLTGKYPTLMHRFLGLQPGRESSGKDATRGTEPTTAILDRPTTNRAIALFILLQASTSLVQNTSNWLAEKVAKHLQARASARRRLRRQQSNAPLTKAQLRNKLDRFFGNDTSEDQEKHNLGNPTLDSSTNTTSKRDDKETTILCTICRLERKHPAAPSSCGHVCCWNCLIQWVSTVRPECPICRAPCSAKDILPLHHYEPVL